jgi:N-acetylglucosaminyldiphosphoundecaprenol N-acetyl-beta-D-mannosaminyltransferase
MSHDLSPVRFTPALSLIMPTDTRKVLGFDVHCITMEEAVQHCLASIRGDRRPRIIATLNAGVLVRARKHERLRRALIASELVLADGKPVFWIARALGGHSARRVTGVDLMDTLIRLAAREGLRLYFLGARPEVNQELVRKVAEEHGGAVIAGARDGYFPRDQDQEVIRAIRESRADILFVGMPTPFKEVWTHENLEALGTPVVLPVGGSFDVLSGFTRRAPVWMQETGLEWLWRLMMDPQGKFMYYLKTHPVFIGMVLKATVLWLRRSCTRVEPHLAPSHPDPEVGLPPD